MRILFAAAASLLFLAGCGQRGGNEQNGSGLPTPPPRPGGEASGNLSSDQNFRQNYRTINIATCVNGLRQQAAQGGAVPPGTDFRPTCTCYIDRAMAGLSVEQLTSQTAGPREEALLEQCAREQRLIPGETAGPDDESGDEPGNGSGGK